MLGALTFGDCPEQVFRDFSTSPYGIDPNRIAWDVEYEKLLYLGTVTIEVGQPWEYFGYGCDDEGYPITFSTTGGTLVVDGNLYTLSGVQMAVGLAYYDITVADIPSDPNVLSASRTGTLVVAGLRKNRPPSLCGGRPKTP